MPSSPGIRVLIVDDHPYVRTALAEVLDDEADLTVVGQCGDGSQVVAAAERLDPDIVCMDVSMPVMDGLAATGALRARNSDVRVILMTAGPTARPEVAAAGAQALVPKTAHPDSLLRCLRAVASGSGGCPYCV
jgi:DNA-binding NarL/FixJ family response regulator